jgi:branched-chain amino acid transport system substrate-binding protein
VVEARQARGEPHEAGDEHRACARGGAEPEGAPGEARGGLVVPPVAELRAERVDGEGGQQDRAEGARLERLTEQRSHDHRAREGQGRAGEGGALGGHGKQDEPGCFRLWWRVTRGKHGPEKASDDEEQGTWRDDRRESMGPGSRGRGAAGLGACSLIVDTSADQCSSNGDCTSKGAAFAGMICSSGVCVSPGGQSGAGGEGGAGGTGGSPACTTTKQCIDQLGDRTICRRPDGVCVSLVSDDCTRVEGDYKSDSAIFIGSVFPSGGSDQSTGLPSENSAVMALRDFNGISGGLPAAKPGGPVRPLVLIGCNDTSSGDVAVRAAQHLVNDLKVPAIIGASFSGITIKMASTVTIPAGVFTISPSATSVAITTLQDNGLLWRTAPSDTLQADAISKVFAQLETEVRKRDGLTTGQPLKVAIVHKGDAYGSGLADALVQSVVFNSKSGLDNQTDGNLLLLNFGNPDDPATSPTKYPETLTQIFAFQPHIILDFGTNESITEIFEKVEKSWATEAKVPNFPFYLFADGGEVSELWGFLQDTDKDDSIRKRVLGTVPGTNNNNYKTFRSLYNSQWSDGTSPDVFGPAGAYDSLYLIAFSAASLGDNAITGAAIADGMKRLVPPGMSVAVGASRINPAFTTLAAGQNIDFDGASGPLNFDLTTGEASSDIQFWCIPKGGDGKAAPATNSSAYYDSASGTVADDAYATIKKNCGF